MNGTPPYRLFGALGSPYSMKMRAILRYRRIPHVWIRMRPEHEEVRRTLKVPVIPILEFPDGRLQNDSTELLYELERRHPAERAIVPEDAADAFLAFLLEDMADEWGAKFMFYYRWFAERDQRQLSTWLGYDRLDGLAEITAFADAFRARQVGRMAIVGCTPQNAPVIEATARRVLSIFETQVTSAPYLFGSRPSLAEFAWYGQLSQLGVDPTPYELMLERAPFTLRWLLHLDDASGEEGEWRPGRRAPAVEQLLAFAGEVYLPFLEANAAAVTRGDMDFTVELDGRPWTQGSFKYQAKCLASLRAAYAALPGPARIELEPLLSRTRCLAPLQPDA